ncbi:hypothetical protein SAMN05216371_6433 [Streptomyces sp. TLI_053]|uniref:hypothetical protein n=1 Tax=Streptomyces sp. TLI_053 TaxID=1855352 RepID=UPI000879C19F|nr:hypothetical protein [Streptomyces sp. TLI_053]SDT80764.1 hypothetical protein SAMN05216371_6433 [Streptomyces sp. TLI_053]
MNTALLYHLLDVDPADGPAELLHRARGSRHLPHLVLSALAREDVRMGEPARAELRRARVRADRYAGLALDLARSTGVRAIHGLPLAGYYPADLLRPQAALDLVAPGEAALWQAVVRLVTDHPVETVDVTLLGDRPHHTAVTLRWPAEDPLLDPWYRVRLATAALPGNCVTVPVRPYLVADEHVECLIALAESQLVNGRHPEAGAPPAAPDPLTLLDLSCLTSQPFEPAETAAVLAAYRLAPEAAALLDLAAPLLPLGTLAAVRTALTPELAPERRRRAEAAAAPRLPVRHGTLLRRTVIRHDWDEARLLGAGDSPEGGGPQGGALLLTPVADYLLGAPEESPTLADRSTALDALHRWDTRC